MQEQLLSDNTPKLNIFNQLALLDAIIKQPDYNNPALQKNLPNPTEDSFILNLINFISSVKKNNYAPITNFINTGNINSSNNKTDKTTGPIMSKLVELNHI